MDDALEKLQEIDPKDVDIACQVEKWAEYRSWPRLLHVLEKKYKPEYLISHEQEIKDHVERHGKYHGSFDFAKHFAGESDHNTLPVSPSSLRDSFSVADSRMNSHGQPHRQMDEDLAGLGDSALFSNPDEPPITQIMQYDPDHDEPPHRLLLRLAKISPWKPVSAWSPAKKTHVPLICGEGQSEYSWISKSALQQLGAEPVFNSDRYAPPETIGIIRLESIGLVRVRCQPYNCVNHFSALFNITEERSAPDLLIGKDLMSEVGNLREQGFSYDNSPKPTGLRSRSVPQNMESRGRRPPDSGFSSQGSQGLGSDGFASGHSRTRESATSFSEMIYPVNNTDDEGPTTLKPPQDSGRRPDDGRLAEHSPGERVPSILVSDSLPQQRALDMPNQRFALSIAVLVTITSLALDSIFLFVAKLQDPSHEVYLGSGISFLFKSAQRLLPNFQLTSLTLPVQVAAVLLGGSWWYRSDLNFFRRPPDE